MEVISPKTNTIAHTSVFPKPCWKFAVVTRRTDIGNAMAGVVIRRKGMRRVRMIEDKVYIKGDGRKSDVSCSSKLF